MPASVTVRSTGAPLAGNGSIRIGATVAPGSERVPLGARSYSLAYNTAWPAGTWPGRALTRRPTVVEPATSSWLLSGAVTNDAFSPGTSVDSRLAALPSTPVRPGSPLIAAGLPPGGFSTCWTGGASSASVCRWVPAPVRPGYAGAVTVRTDGVPLVRTEPCTSYWNAVPGSAPWPDR